jgi:hypothetical protein
MKFRAEFDSNSPDYSGLEVDAPPGPKQKKKLTSLVAWMPAMLVIF